MLLFFKNSCVWFVYFQYTFQAFHQILWSVLSPINANVCIVIFLFILPDVDPQSPGRDHVLLVWAGAEQTLHIPRDGLPEIIGETRHSKTRAAFTWNWLTEWLSSLCWLMKHWSGRLPVSPWGAMKETSPFFFPSASYFCMCDKTTHNK